MKKTYNTCPDCGASINRPKIRCSPCGYEKRLADNRRRAAAVAKQKSAELRARKAILKLTATREQNGDYV